MGALKTITGRFKLLRHGPLPREEHASHLPQHHMKSETRHRRPGGAMQGSSQRLAKIFHGLALRRDDIDRAAERSVLDREKNGPDHVLTVHPGKILPARAQWSADEKAERR